MRSELILGADPGGIGSTHAGKFGVAALWIRNERCISFTSECVRGVDSAMNWFRGQLEDDVPTRMGIDCIMFWRTGDAGRRWVDERLKSRYPKFANSVKTINELYGSMAVQGITLAHRAREDWPLIELNETHPKLLRAALVGDNFSEKLADRLGLVCSELPDNSHQLDAVIAAASAWHGKTWGYDAVEGEIRDGRMTGSFPIFPIKDVHYWWPHDLGES